MEITFVNDEFSSDIDDVINFAKKNGLKYIELRKINDKEISELSQEEAAAISNKLSSNGVLVSCISSQFLKWTINKTEFSFSGYSATSETEYFIQLLDMADIFGASNIRIYSYFKQDDITIDELAQKLDIYSQLALERGITLLLENDGLCNIDTVEKMYQLFRMYNFSNIFPLLDLGSTIAAEDDFNPQELQALIGNCFYFHIKDYDAKLKRFVVIGEGNIDYEDILNSKINDNSCTLSLEPHTGYPEDLQMSLNILQSYES